MLIKLTCVHIGLFGVVRVQGFAVGERLYHRMPRQLQRMVVDVVPHHKFAEREQPKHGFVEHVPSWPRHDGIAHDGHHLPHVHAIAVGGQRRQPWHGQLELLLDHLDECHIDDRFLAPRANDVIAARVPDEINRYHQNGSISRLDAAVGLIPLEYAQRQKQRIGSILFECDTRCAVYVLEHIDRLSVREIATEPFVFQLIDDKWLPLLLHQCRVVDAMFVWQETTLCR